MTTIYLSEAALDRIDREYRRLLRRQHQREFDRRIAPPPVIGSDYVPPEAFGVEGLTPAEKRERRLEQNHRPWAPEVTLAFNNATVIRRKETKR